MQARSARPATAAAWNSAWRTASGKGRSRSFDDTPLRIAPAEALAIRAVLDHHKAQLDQHRLSAFAW
jgi:hypothetical protein